MMLYGCTRVSARGHAVSDGGDKHVNRHLDWRPAKLVLTKDILGFAKTDDGSSGKKTMIEFIPLEEVRPRLEQLRR